MGVRRPTLGTVRTEPFLLDRHRVSHTVPPSLVNSLLQPDRRWDGGENVVR